MPDAREPLAQSAAEIDIPDLQPDTEEWPDAFGRADQSGVADLPDIPQPQEAKDDWPTEWPGEQPNAEQTANIPSPFEGLGAQQNAEGGMTFSMYSPPGEQGGATQMPGGSQGLTEAKQDLGMYDLLKQIADGISQLTGAKQAVAPQDVGAQSYQFPWAEKGFQPLEQTESYSQASPSFPMTTTLNGMRGAGGPAGGTKQGSQSQADFMYPQRHHIGEE